MVELLVIILLVWTIIRASRRLITPLWTILELLAWIVIGAIIWVIEHYLGTEAALTILAGILIVVVWMLGRQVRELREAVSRLNEELAKR